MLQRIVLLYTLTAAGSAIAPKRNLSTILKNVTGEAHWYPPPPYWRAQAPPSPSYYPAPTGPLPSPSLYPPSPVYGPQQPPPVPQPAYITPAYHVPRLGPPIFGPPSPFFPPASSVETPPYALDHYYCSAQASFALVNGGGIQPFVPLPQPMPFPPTGDSFDGPKVGLLSPGEAGSNIPLGATRQFCRYTATLDSYACSYCCKIAARHYSTSIDEVTGILFAFDPDMPPVLPVSPVTGASLNRKKRAPETDNGKWTTPPHTEPIPTSPLEDVTPDPIPGPAPVGPGLGSVGAVPPLPPILPMLPVPPPLPAPRRVPQCFCCAPKKFFG